MTAEATATLSAARRRFSPEERRQDFIRKAAEFFSERGFDGGTRELARKLGVTQPLETWLDALAHGGRLMLPVTAPLPAMGSTLGKGVVVLITRQRDGALQGGDCGGIVVGPCATVVGDDLPQRRCAGHDPQACCTREPRAQRGRTSRAVSSRLPFARRLFVGMELVQQAMDDRRRQNRE